MAEELYQKQRERARSRSVRRAKSIADSKKREMTPLEKHNLLTATVAKMGHDMTVFHLRWVPGDYLDEDILNSVPMFWFKKFGWRPEDIKVLYAVGSMKMSQSILTEMQKVYGKKGSSNHNHNSNSNNKKGGSKKSKKLQNHVLLKDQTPQSPTVNDSEEAVYMRTKRLKKSNVSSQNVLSNSRKNSRSFSRSESHDPSASNNIGYDTPQNKPMGAFASAAAMMKTQGSIDLTDNNSFGGDNNNNDEHRDRADTSDLKLPRATHSFSSHHRRQSSMSNRRPSLVESGELIWSRLAATRGDTLNSRQFDIELQNNNILADPDISAELFDVLRDYKKDVKTINKQDLVRVYPQLDSIPLKDEIEDPQSLGEKEKIMIVLKQVLYHVMSQTPFDVNDYLTPKLKYKDLNDSKKIIKELGSRDSDWRIRLQIMEWITANMEEDNTVHTQLNDLALSENLGPFLLGWMTQCLDERSNLAKAALYMFPEVFGMTITKNLEAFTYLNDIMKSLFCVLRNKRSEQLATIADQTTIEIIEMIMEWHQNHQLDNEILLEICEIFRDNTSMKEQKHGKVRERCCAYFGYILYGLDTSELNNNNNNNNKNNKNDNDSKTDDKNDDKNHLTNNLQVASPLSPLEVASSSASPSSLPETNGKISLKTSKSDQSHTQNDKNDKKKKKKDKKGSKDENDKNENKNDEKENDKDDEKKDNNNNKNDDNSSTIDEERRKVTIKISKEMRRKYLLDSPQFGEYMSAALEKSTADKEEHVRNVAFRLMSKLEKTDPKILSDIFKSDPYTMKRFDKYKSRKMAKAGKSPKAGGRRGTVSAVKQAREKAMLLKRGSTPHHGQVGAAKTMPVDVKATVETSMD